MYHVHFPVAAPLPKMLAITFNDRLLCSETAEPEPFVTLSLEHTFYSSQSIATETPTTVQETQRPVAANTYTVASVTTTRSYPKVVTSQMGSCGVPDFKPVKTTGLVYGGFFAMRKQFPW